MFFELHLLTYLLYFIKIEIYLSFGKINNNKLLLNKSKAGNNEVNLVIWLIMTESSSIVT